MSRIKILAVAPESAGIVTLDPQVCGVEPILEIWLCLKGESHYSALVEARP